MPEGSRAGGGEAGTSSDAVVPWPPPPLLGHRLGFCRSIVPSRPHRCLEFPALPKGPQPHSSRGQFFQQSLSWLQGTQTQLNRGKNRVGSRQALLDPETSTFSHVALSISGPSEPQSVVLLGRGGSRAPDDTPYPLRQDQPDVLPASITGLPSFDNHLDPGMWACQRSCPPALVPGPPCPQPGNASCSTPGVPGPRSSAPSLL